MGRGMWMAVVLGLCAGGASGAQEPEALSAIVKTKDGSSLVCALKHPQFRMATAVGEIAVPFAQVARVSLAGAQRAATVEFRNQDRLSGTFVDRWVAVDTAFGLRKIQAASIREIEMRFPVRQDGLLAWYSFDDDPGPGGKVRDASGNGRDGQAFGAVFAPDGKRGGACQVGRNRGYLQIPHDAAWDFAGKPFGISLWVKLDQPPGVGNMLVSHDAGGGPQDKWAFWFWQGKLCLHVNSPQGEDRQVALASWRPEVGRWHHLALTREGSEFRIYADGACVGKERMDAPLPNAKAPLLIGQGEGFFVEGALDEVKVFGRALSAEEIRQLADSAD